MADTVTLSAESSADIRHAISENQNIQRNNPPRSLAWRLASATLATLFAEMQARPSMDVLTGEYQRWARSQPGNVLERGDAEEALTHSDTTDAQKAFLRSFIARWERTRDVL